MTLRNFFIVKCGFMFILISVVFCVKSDNEYKIVETNDGAIRGLRKTTLLKQIDFYSFKGIPYAKPPVDDLRFKAPKPVESWSPNVIDAFEHGSTCWRPSTLAPDDLPKSEDCLFLNIYAPANIQPDEKLAVVVYIHGGCFIESSGNDNSHGPDFLLEQNVIVITMNYRLGLFGFLTFDLPEYSGNMGLKDQQLALKWIHKNIEHFSGDKNRITLIGESAGSAAAHFHVLSSESRKYFNNVISLSGTAQNKWALSNTEDILNFAHKIAKKFEAPQNTTEGLIQLLKSVPAEELVEHTYLTGLIFFEKISALILTPIIEKKDAIQPFITEYPEEIYKNEKIENDAMFGFCSLEQATFFTPAFESIYDVKSLNEKFHVGLPFHHNLEFHSPEYKQIANEIRETYFKDAPINEDVSREYLEMLSDINFGYGINKAARNHATKTAAKSYYFRFSIKSKLNVFTMNTKASHFPDHAGHADDICYIFRCSSVQPIYNEILSTPNDEYSKISLNAIENITKLISNFGKYGTPDPNNKIGFLPIENETVNFLDVKNDGLVPGANPNHKAHQFWSRIEQKLIAINEKSNDEIHDEL